MYISDTHKIEAIYFEEKLNLLQDLNSKLKEAILEIFKVTQKRIHSFTTALEYGQFDNSFARYKGEILEFGQIAITARMFRKKISGKDTRYSSSIQKAVSAYLKATEGAHFSNLVRNLCVPNRSPGNLLDVFNAFSPIVNGFYNPKQAFDVEYKKSKLEFPVNQVELFDWEEDKESQSELTKQESCQNSGKPKLVRSNASTGDQLEYDLAVYPFHTSIRKLNAHVCSFVVEYLYSLLSGGETQQKASLRDQLVDKFAKQYWELGLSELDFFPMALNTYIKCIVLHVSKCRNWEEIEIFDRLTASNQDEDCLWLIEWGGLSCIDYSAEFASTVRLVNKLIELNFSNFLNSLTPRQIIDKTRGFIIKTKEERNAYISQRKANISLKKEVLEARVNSKITLNLSRGNNTVDRTKEWVSEFVRLNWDLDFPIYGDGTNMNLQEWFKEYNAQSKSCITIKRPYSTEFLSLLKDIREYFQINLDLFISSATLTQYIHSSINELKKNGPKAVG